MAKFMKTILYLLVGATVSGILYRVYHMQPMLTLKHRAYNLNTTEITSCSKLINGSPSEMKKAKYMSKVRHSPPLFSTESCEKFEKSAGFHEHCVSDEEKDLPIAFAIVMYKDVEQTMRLLRAIYRPHNLYCIHVDAKSPDNSVFSPIKFLSGCYENVFLPRERIKVVYHSFKDLKPEIVCLRELLKNNVKWKYFINLTGQEFPLKTNYEIVKILQAYNGANDIEKVTNSYYINSYKERYASLKLPHGLRPIQGATHVVASRRLMEFAINSQTGKDFLHWIEKNEPQIPGELFYATIANNPQLHIPGTYIGDRSTNGTHYARHKIWVFNNRKCYGHFLRGICVFGVRDLPGLVASPALFANKFLYEFQSVAYDCLEYWYIAKTRMECTGKRGFDNSVYRSPIWVKNVQ